MKISEFKKTLSENSYRNIRFILPTGTKAPPHAHVTEVALIEKKFIDCGGTFRTDSLCRLQTWFADDTDHRLTAGKLLAILDKSASFLVQPILKWMWNMKLRLSRNSPLRKLKWRTRR